jgi:hypothetical protein
MLSKIVPINTSTSPNMGHVPTRPRGGSSLSRLDVNHGVMLGQSIFVGLNTIDDWRPSSSTTLIGTTPTLLNVFFHCFFQEYFWNPFNTPFFFLKNLQNFVSIITLRFILLKFPNFCFVWCYCLITSWKERLHNIKDFILIFYSLDSFKKIWTCILIYWK